jgi:hypothetical protein
MARLDVPQGTLDLMILTVLDRGPMHGYGLSQRLAALSHDSFQLNPGSLFPSLYRLEQDGKLRALDPGFVARPVVIANFAGSRVPPPPDIVDVVGRLPAVTAASLTTHTPLDGSAWSEPAVPAGQSLPSAIPRASSASVQHSSTSCRHRCWRDERSLIATPPPVLRSPSSARLTRRDSWPTSRRSVIGSRPRCRGRGSPRRDSSAGRRPRPPSPRARHRSGRGGRRHGLLRARCPSRQGGRAHQRAARRMGAGGVAVLRLLLEPNAGPTAHAAERQKLDGAGRPIATESSRDRQGSGARTDLVVTQARLTTTRKPM